MSYAGDGVCAWGEIERRIAIVGIGTLLVDLSGACAIGIEDGYVETVCCLGECASGRERLLLEWGDMEGYEGLAIRSEKIAEGDMLARGEEDKQRQR